MGEKKQMLKVLFPLMTGLDKDENKDQWKGFKAYMGKIWDQFQDMQKTAKDAQKEQWEKFFPQYMEMKKTLISSLPDKAPAIPGLPENPISPKEILQKMLEFQETANSHAVEQNDALFSYCVEGQQQVKDMVVDAVKNVETKMGEAASK